MKLIKILALLFIAIATFSCKSEPAHNGYIVSGTIDGANDGMITLSTYDVSNRTSKAFDSTAIKNGNFEFKGFIENPDQVILSIGRLGSSRFFIENSTITINAKLGESKDGFTPIDATINGSSLQDVYQAYLEASEAIMNDPKYKALNDLNKAYNEAGRARDIELSKTLYAKFKDYSELSDERSKRSLDLALDFVEKNGTSPVATQVLGYRFNERTFNLNEMADLLNKFSGAAKETGMYKHFVDEYESIKNTSPGGKAPDFSLKTPEGNDLALSEIKDKYILLDFWASWCGPCRASYPHLKKVYQKYKDAGFEVLAISTDTDHDKWKKAIEEDQTKWLQVVDTFSRKNMPSDIGTLYAVPFLPTTFLLDKEGIILAKNLHADELDKKLEEIFGF